MLPSYFNAAEKWAGMIHDPLDQGNCAGSWAFSTAGRKMHSSISQHQNSQELPLHWVDGGEWGMLGMQEVG